VIVRKTVVRLLSASSSLCRSGFQLNFWTGGRSELGMDLQMKEGNLGSLHLHTDFSFTLLSLFFSLSKTPLFAGCEKQTQHQRIVSIRLSVPLQCWQIRRELYLPSPTIYINNGSQLLVWRRKRAITFWCAAAPVEAESVQEGSVVRA
jgi:hypothetical protein